jgi:hypothetical protein
MLMKTKQREEKDLLTGKLLSYSAAAGALLAIGSNAEAQVIYTDVDPDSIVVSPELGSAGLFEIDLNGDGIVDVTIMAGSGDKWYSGDSASLSLWKTIRALPGTGGEVNIHPSYLTSWSNTYNFGKRLDAEAQIGPDLGEGDYWSGGSAAFELGWLGTYSATDQGPYNTGPWIDEEEPDKYLGIRFTLDEGVSYHYGWVRLNVPTDVSQVTVIDYAYEQTADTPITAGDMGSGTSIGDGHVDPGVKVFSFNRSIIVSDLETDHARADIFNVAGQLIQSVQVEQGRTEIPMDDTGLYLVRIDTGKGLVSKKVIVR